MMQYFWKSYSHKAIGFVPLILCLVLGGCSTTSETFDCKAGQGVGCKSISEVNQMVDHGTLAASVETHVSETRVLEKDKQSILPFLDTRVSAPVISADSSIVDNLGGKDPTSHPGMPLSDTLLVHRIPEQHLRVWIAPFQDAQGNFHEGSIVHTVLKSGFWQISPKYSQSSRYQDTDPSISSPEINNLEEVD